MIGGFSAAVTRRAGLGYSGNTVCFAIFRQQLFKTVVQRRLDVRAECVLPRSLVTSTRRGSRRSFP